MALCHEVVRSAAGPAGRGEMHTPQIIQFRLVGLGRRTEQRRIPWFEILMALRAHLANGWSDLLTGTR